MFQLGERVVYGVHGVCCVTDMEERIIDGKRRQYLVLEPVGQDGARYLVPTHNAVAMGKLRQMLTALELERLLQSEEIRQDGWIRDENLRKQAYRELIGSGDRVRLMKMVRTLYRHKSAQTTAGKKIHQCDDNFLRDAEKLLVSEVSLVMDIPYDQARVYLRETLQNV